MDVIHTCLWVSDVEETLSFYVDGLGLERTREFVGSDYQSGTQNVYVSGPNGIEIQFKHNSSREVSELAGVDHVAFSVEDVDGEFERIVDETGCPVVMEPTTLEQTGTRIAFVEDPDGYRVELVERP